LPPSSVVFKSKGSGEWLREKRELLKAQLLRRPRRLQRRYSPRSRKYSRRLLRQRKRLKRRRL